MSIQDHQEQVRNFMAACGQRTPVCPEMPSEKAIKLRVNLINEEFTEFVNSIPDFPSSTCTPEVLAGIADSIADLLYVVYGSAVTFGIDIHPVFNEVHRSNMTKFSGNVELRPDGKVMKGSNYEPPRITNIIDYQIATCADKVDMTIRGGIEWEEVKK